MRKAVLEGLPELYRISRGSVNTTHWVALYSRSPHHCCHHATKILSQLLLGENLNCVRVCQTKRDKDEKKTEKGRRRSRKRTKRGGGDRDYTANHFFVWSLSMTAATLDPVARFLGGEERA